MRLPHAQGLLMLEGLSAQRVLVIGGSSGIGEASALTAAQAGAAVTIASRSRQKLDAALSRLPSGGLRLNSMARWFDALS
jgi:NAD(P)-dependent dehydrogenase (short-subunit alcohol dehydrogenase family)